MSFTYKEVIKKIKDLTTIVIFDEDLKLLDAIKHYLSQEQFHVITGNSIEIGIKKLKQIQPDIIILDTNIKQRTKKTVLQELKREKKLKNLPFIFLTAKGMTKDRIQWNIGRRFLLIFRPQCRSKLHATARLLALWVRPSWRLTASMSHLVEASVNEVTICMA